MIKTVKPLLATVFLDVLSGALLVPVLPFFVQQLGGDARDVGFVFAAGAAVAALATPYWGRFADRYGERRALVLSQLIGAAGFVALAFAPSLFAIYAARALQGAEGGNLGIVQSYMSKHVTDPNDRVTALGHLGATMRIAFFVGAAAAGILAPFGARTILMVVAVVQVFSIPIMIVLLPRSPAGHAPRPAGWLRVFRERDVILWMAPQLLGSIGWSAWVAVFALYAQATLGFATREVSVLYAFSAAVGIGVQILGIGRLRRLIGERRLLIGAVALLLVAYSYAGLVHAVWQFVVLLIFWSTGLAISRPLINSRLISVSPADRRASVLSVSEGLTYVAAVFAPVLSVIVFQRSPYYAGIVPAICTAMMFGLVLTLSTLPQPAVD